MNDSDLSRNLSSPIILTLAVFSFILVFSINLFMESNTGKTVYTACLLGFVLPLSLIYITSNIIQRLKTSSFNLIEFLKSPLLIVALAASPYITISLISQHPIKQIVYIILIMGLIALADSFKFSASFFRGLSAILITTVLFHLLAYPAHGFPEIYNSFFAQKNVFALNILIIFFAAIIVSEATSDSETRIATYITMGICIILILLSRSRGALLDIIFFITLRFIWKPVCKNKYLYWILFASVLLTLVLFVPAYVLFSYTPTGINLNSIVRDYTGVNLFSGRNIIWPAYLYLISLKPFLGYGFGEDVANMMVMLGLPQDVLGLSAHNLYLMVATQTGILGLSGLIIFFGVIWAKLYKNRETKIGSLVCVMFLTGLFNEIFEVTLIQTNLDVVAYFWFLVGLGLRNDLNVQKPANYH